MQTFAPGHAVNFSIPLVGADGLYLSPTALRYRIVNEDNSVVLDWAAAPITGPQLDLTLDAAYTDLGIATRALRTVELEVTTVGGTIALYASVMLQAATVLQVPDTSFLTYGQALLLADTLSAQVGWGSASREDRERALLDAKRKIDTLHLEQNRAGWSNADASFKDAARLAQILEANDLLCFESDPIMQARESGLISMTVGESSQFFRSAKKIDTGLCSRAMKVLAPYIGQGGGFGTVRIGRA